MQANPDHWLWLLVSILTVWRLTTLICYEDGPFRIMNKTRAALYKIRLGSLIDCFHCTAFWISIIIVLVLYKLSFSQVFLIPSCAGGASVIERLLSYFSTSNHEIKDEND